MELSYLHEIRSIKHAPVYKALKLRFQMKKESTKKELNELYQNSVELTSTRMEKSSTIYLGITLERIIKLFYEFDL